MTMITPSYLGETIEYSSLHACRSTLEDPTLSRRAVSALRDAESAGNLRVSVISVWELGMLQEHGRVALPMNIRSWVEEALTKPGISLALLSPEIAIEGNAADQGSTTNRVFPPAARPGAGSLASTIKGK